MSYQVLARKWRPQVFEDVVGQGHITLPLQNAIISGRLAHAFLFSGPRGVGKTTMARILAKAINCANGPTTKPCGKCDSCIETATGNSVDVIEIDGASNRGIEHIRELREAVKYAPVVGKYKVYVIDEVHMLTNEAFNALLKTLEEPPDHVIFIFATTEPQKVIATIQSRCQRYAFKRISIHEIVDRLRLISNSEGIAISDQGLAIIARAAEGSMRDAQSLLDQAVSYSGRTIADDDLQETLGSIAQISLQKFTESLLSKDAAALLKQVDELLEQGQDMRQFLSGVVEHVRNLLVLKLMEEPEQIVELPTADINAIRQQASTASVDQLLLIFDSLSRTLDEMRWSPHQRFTLEVGCIKASKLENPQPLADIILQMKEVEARIASVQQMNVGSERVAHQTDKKKIINTIRAPGNSTGERLDEEASHQEAWDTVVRTIESQKPNLASCLEHSQLIKVSSTELVVGVAGAFQIGQVEKRDNRAYIEQLLEQIYKKKLQLIIQRINNPTGSGVKNKQHAKAKAPEADSSIKDVLRVFTEGEVLEQNTSPEDNNQ